MNQKNFPGKRTLGSLAALTVAAALLQACGGGGSAAVGTGGTASAISPTVAGTVTGFGSVFIDGFEVHDLHARIARENADGSLSNAVLQMGQRVRLSHDGQGNASQVLIDAAVVGIVSAVNTTAGSLQVAGQRVLVNTDSAAGPVTVFAGGYTDLASVALNDLVEVHGTLVYDTATAGYKVQATRIQKATGVSRVLVNGKISSYAATTGGATFTVNGLSVVTNADTRVRPNGATLAEGTQVTVFGNAISGNVLTASNVRVNRDQDSGNTVMLAQLSGTVSSYDATAGSFELAGTRIKVGSATVLPAGASLRNGAYVMVRGAVGSDGSVTASSIVVRTSDTSADLARVMLIGAISDFVDSSSFVVRGVPVDAAGAALVNCPASLSNDLAVRVEATQQAGTAVVKATRIICSPVTTEPLTRPVDGTASAVNATAHTFTLTRSNASTQAVLWNDMTTFVGVTADTLNGKTLRVEGYLDGSTLVARVIRLDDGTPAAAASGLDDARFRAARPAADGASAAANGGGNGVANGAANAASAPEGWARYRSGR